MPVVVLGANHRTAPIAVRERLAVGRSEAPGVLAELVDGGVATEAVLLSTCNRTEVYLSLPEERPGIEAVRGLLEARAPEVSDLASRHLYVHRDRAAVGHLFRVSAGLDSMVVGEPQIQGQVREAYEIARETEGDSGPVVGTVLNRLFQNASAVGGRVRTETQIGVGAASVSSAAVDLAKKIFGSLRGRRALVLGAGEMSEVTLECLLAEGVESTLVANRTYERARELATRVSGVALRYDAVESALSDVDIVICSTAAPHPVITRSRLRQALPHGVARPLCIIDIAIPRDVEPAVGDESNVFLYNIDDLQQIVGSTLERRRSELPLAEAIIETAVEDYWSWYSGLAVVPTIRELRDRSEQVRQQETERLLRRLAHLSDADREAVEVLTRSLLNKLLHAPTVRLRQAAGNGRGTAVVDTVRYLFGLDAVATEVDREEGEPADPAADSSPAGKPRRDDPDTSSPRDP